MKQQKLANIQGSYFIFTGSWPLLHLSSFLEMTGSKTDIWLIKTVSLLLISIGISLILLSKRNDRESFFALAGLSALSLAIIDFYYASTGTISGIYFLDGVIEIVFLIANTRIYYRR